MKHLMTVLFIGLLSFSVNAQEKVAKIEFKETTIDYGTIEKGADGERVFEYTNTGDAPLLLTNVKASCGCTIPKWSNKPTMPGESNVIHVKYDTKRVNPFRKTITVTSNADTPTVALKIKGEILDPAKTSVLEKSEKSVMEK